ncbi:MAG: hypothetical protein QGH06_08430 [Lutibacter sp.]|nr:hypothetical protein [Lutibacter sp.]
MTNVKIAESWRPYLEAEFDKPYFAALTRFVRSEYTQYTCYPPGKQVFDAFKFCVQSVVPLAPPSLNTIEGDPVEVKT